ncbi:MAG: hypothetical protein NZ480_08305, partial [Bdellovibrionaceae bacterium]|nr:hypothetical protein [Pseudobdellovibrionaceae bacterium]
MLLLKLTPSELPNPEKFFSDFLQFLDLERSHSKGVGRWMDKLVALVFFEPSTRTRLSFETAVMRLGAKTITLSGSVGSSLEKGESEWDTVRNIAALGPDAMVIRAGEAFPFEDLKTHISVPIICGGWGQTAHPTQALLDVAVLWQEWSSLKGKRILYVGDGKHSRVLASHQQLLRPMGAKLGFLVP